MYLKQQKLVTKAARPSLGGMSTSFVCDEEELPAYRMTSGTQERDANVSRLQRATVVGSIAAKAATVVNGLQSFHQFMLLVRRHACKDVTSNQQLEQSQDADPLRWHGVRTLCKTTSSPKSTIHRNTSPVTAKL
ncbi:MAG: hypothetical protein Q9222_000905 [Ikaeria aurantiellina]